MQRIEQLSGFPDVDFEERPHPDGGSTLHGSTRQFGLTLKWVERPFEWVANREYRIERVYTKGPVDRIISVVRIEQSPHGSVLHQTMCAQPKNAFWSLAAKALIGMQLRRSFLSTYKKIDSIVCDGKGSPSQRTLTLHNSQADSYRLKLLGRRLAQRVSSNLAQLLLIYLQEADDRELLRIRPLNLAKEWGTTAQETIILFLESTKLGLTTLHWDLLCPRCRNAPQRVSSFAQITQTVHCASCNIDFETDLSKNVEAVFCPHEGVRRVEAQNYCTAGPQTTPHIVLQKTIEGMDEWTTSFSFSPGQYLLRSPQLDFEVEVRVDEDGANSVVFSPSYSERHIHAHPNAKWLIKNPSHKSVVMLLEDQTWKSNCITANDVAILGGERDFFANQIMRPDQTISVSHLWFLLSDVVHSVALYEQKGDARSYALIQEEFESMTESIEAHNGSVFKTAGDSVMAIFRSPKEAIKATLAHSKKESTLTQDGHRLATRFAIHGGPCLAINNDGHLDYFGQTVNITARLVSAANQNEIMMLSEQSAEIDVSHFLEDANITTTKESLGVKGIMTSFDVTRIQIPTKKG